MPRSPCTKTSPRKRKGGSPTDSATCWTVGSRKKGTDGSVYTVAKIGKSQRWVKSPKSPKSPRASHKSPKSAKSGSPQPDSALSTSELKHLKTKYEVSGSGSRNTIAETLWRIRGSAMDTSDLASIIPLLNKQSADKASVLIGARSTPTRSYKGMWKKQPKPLREMNRSELTRHLRSFRNAWESATTRNQDLDDERLEYETTEGLRELLKFYYSDAAKNMAESWLSG